MILKNLIDLNDVRLYKILKMFDCFCTNDVPLEGLTGS